jgi:hypothetical protein
MVVFHAKVVMNVPNADHNTITLLELADVWRYVVMVSVFLYNVMMVIIMMEMDVLKIVKYKQDIVA